MASPNETRAKPKGRTSEAPGLLWLWLGLGREQGPETLRLWIFVVKLALKEPITGVCVPLPCFAPWREQNTVGLPLPHRISTAELLPPTESPETCRR